MELSGWAGTFYRVGDWLMRLAYVNILWMLFTGVGLVIFGFFPATAAMFAVTRKWVMGDADIPVFQTFWSYYKKEFKKSNILGFFIVVIGLILYIDLQILPAGGLSFFLLKWALIILSFIFMIMLVYFFPIYVHFDFPLSQYFKYPLIMIIVAPLQTILLLASTYGVYLLMATIPGLIPFFGGSLISFVWLWIILNFLERVKQKEKQKTEGT